MAATEAKTKAFIQVTAIDADWDMTETLQIYSIVFTPGAVDDELVIFDGSVAGGIYACSLKSSDGEPRVEYFGGAPMRAVIDFSACTLNANHRVKFVLKR